MMKKIIFLSILLNLFSCRCLEMNTKISMIRFPEQNMIDNQSDFDYLFINLENFDTLQLSSNNYKVQQSYTEHKCIDYEVWEANYFNNKFYFKTYYEKKSKKEDLIEKIEINGKVYDIHRVSNITNNFTSYLQNTYNSYYVYQIITSSSDTFWFHNQGLFQFNVKSFGKYGLLVKKK